MEMKLKTIAEICLRVTQSKMFPLEIAAYVKSD